VFNRVDYLSFVTRAFLLLSVIGFESSEVSDIDNLYSLEVHTAYIQL